MVRGCGGVEELGGHDEFGRVCLAGKSIGDAPSGLVADVFWVTVLYQYDFLGSLGSSTSIQSLAPAMVGRPERVWWNQKRVSMIICLRVGDEARGHSRWLESTIDSKQ